MIDDRESILALVSMLVQLKAATGPLLGLSEIGTGFPYNIAIDLLAVAQHRKNDFIARRLKRDSYSIIHQNSVLLHHPPQSRHPPDGHLEAVNGGCACTVL